MKYSFTFICLLLLSGCDKISQPAGSYDDCLLSNMKGVTTPSIIETVKGACKQKYPKEFDFDEIARNANVMSWKNVLKHKEVFSKTAAVKKEIESEYFTDIIQPRVHPEYIVEARSQFESYSRKIQNELNNSTLADPSLSLSKPEASPASSVAKTVTGRP